MKKATVISAHSLYFKNSIITFIIFSLHYIHFLKPQENSPRIAELIYYIYFFTIRVSYTIILIQAVTFYFGDLCQKSQNVNKNELSG